MSSYNSFSEENVEPINRISYIENPSKLMIPSSVTPTISQTELFHASLEENIQNLSLSQQDSIEKIKETNKCLLIMNKI